MKSRFYQIDFIRTAAFLMIFVSHITRLNHHDNGLGCGGVSLFMILSGFLMFYNHGDEIDGKVSVSGLWRAGVGYYKKGLGKFYKGHIITFVSGALLQAYWLIRWFSVEGFWGAVQTAVPNILLFQSFIPKGEYYFSYNAVSWFLCDILFFYFCFPFLAQMIKRQKIFLGGGTAAAVVLLYVLFAGMAGGFPEQKWLLYICPLVRLADFGLGMVLCAQIKDSDLHRHGCVGTVSQISVRKVAWTDFPALGGVCPCHYEQWRRGMIFNSILLLRQKASMPVSPS